ncbi:NifB/NifX family molybdenum-iron cluster-binding protein [Proteiniphilum sp. UBA1028]|jgi:predicted Fe-Mo cluster-binding NifX family protein|uniref:NifB/NifX family molybdenum-iron cluster-binding protein n=1 Tax=Proteiniphilum sp. UBA1028 TaxID=1947251 RepID=UPI000E7FA562|nr:NifB/NifX family molybdenum-iron cluster-binding protein [Proteiniphilum sp. UBA1028]HBG56526.1 dinitrogenase iron-molybdenum cofactor biosynthesis protein [Porphyromonadaceae bacterium]
MKIAVPTKENNQIDAHFGHCEFYTIYTVSEKDDIVDKQILRSPAGCGCKSDIALNLSQMDVRIMLAGGIGEGAINKLSSCNIEVIRNCKGDVDELVNEYLAGNLKDGGASCQSHAHDESHVCSH